LTEELHGCDELRKWLVSRFFRCYKNYLPSEFDECNWYACRRTLLQSRECECNDGKPVQVVVRPFSMSIHGQEHRSADVDVTGEAGGIWYKLSAYGLSHEELRERLYEVEIRLIDAWNALIPKAKP
jgi:hypothetical protein